MIKIRYDETTKEITGWRGTEDRFDSLSERVGQATVILDIPIPAKNKNAYLYDNKIGLIPNPAYIEPRPPRDLTAEINVVNARLRVLEGTHV